MNQTNQKIFYKQKEKKSLINSYNLKKKELTFTELIRRCALENIANEINNPNFI
jgi:ribosomal protein S3AE